MSSIYPLRSRENIAQRHALAQVERQIRAAAPNSRSKYVREFAEAYSSYHSVLSTAQWTSQLKRSRVVLVGDYHAMASYQRFCESVLILLRSAGRHVVLGLETVLSRHQHLLDRWLAREITGNDLRSRMHYDKNWGYAWDPFRHLLETARARCEHVYGLDCELRDDFRRIAQRDHHAAERIADLRARHPDAVLVVLFGESHLAPTHLPRHLRSLIGNTSVLTILQNIDALYWRTVEECGRAEAVRVRDDVICVFNAAPLEKYESYHRYLQRWGLGPASARRH